VVEIDPTPVRAQVMLGEPELAVAVNATVGPPAATVGAEGLTLIDGADAGGSTVMMAMPEVYPGAEATSVAVVCAATLAGGV
jgi:hypothetical protein